MSFIVTDLHGKSCQITWFLSCLAVAGRGGKLTWRSCLFGWQAVLTVEMHARQHLVQSSVYSKRMLYVKDMSERLNVTSDHIGVHTESCVCKVWVRGMQGQSAVRRVRSPCYVGWRDSSAHTQKLLLSGCFTVTADSMELLRLERSVWVKQPSWACVWTSI